MRAILISTVLALAASAQDTELRTYDLSGICDGLPAARPPSVGFSFAPAESHPDAGPLDWSVEVLVEALRSVLEEAFAGASFDVTGKTFSVSMPPEDHAKLAALLDELERRVSRTLLVQVEVLDVRADVLDADTRPGPLPDDASLRLAGAAADPARGRVLRRLSVRASAGRFSSATAGARRTCVQDFDLEIAQGAVAPDDEVVEDWTGAALQVRPFFRIDGSSVVLDTRLALSRELPPARVELPAALGGPLDLPCKDILEVRTFMSVPVEGSALLAVAPSLEGREGWETVVLLGARLESPPESRGGPSTGVAVWDLGACYAAMAEGFRGPDLGLKRPAENEIGLGGCTFGWGSELDEVVGLIEAADREGWAETGRAMALFGDLLIVAAPHAVQQQVGTLLEDLQSSFGADVFAEGWLIRMPASAWEDRRAVFSRADGIPAEHLADLLGAARSGGDFAVVAHSSALGRIGARFHNSRGRRRWAVSESDVEIAEASKGWDPVVEPLDDGLNLDARLIPVAGSRVFLDLRSAWVEARLNDPFDANSPGGLPLHLPTCDRLPLDCRAPATAGRVILVSTEVGMRGGKEEVRIFLARGGPISGK